MESLITDLCLSGMGGVNNSSVALSDTDGVNNQPVVLSDTGGVNNIFPVFIRPAAGCKYF